MRKYGVLLDWDGSVEYFRCDADGRDHALEQAESAYPGSRVRRVTIERVSSIATLYSLGIEVETYPNGDRWGSAMSALGDISHALDHYGRDYLPSAWGFRDSPACQGLDKHSSGENDNARTIAAWFLRHPEREREIIRSGNVLDRYIGRLDRAGLSY